MSVKCFKVLAVSALTVMSACSSGMGASLESHPFTGVPQRPSSDPGATPSGSGDGTVTSGIVVVTRKGASANDTLTGAGTVDSVHLEVDDLPSTIPSSADTGSAIGTWLLNVGAGFHVGPAPVELSCLAALHFNDDQLSAAIAGTGKAWTSTAGCLSPVNAAAVAVMRAMDVELADTNDVQYSCVEKALDLDRTIDGLHTAEASCQVKPR